MGKSWGKYFIIFTLTCTAALLGWLFYSTFYFSNSFGALHIVQDEYHSHRNLLMSWDTLRHYPTLINLVNTSCGYGSFYWDLVTAALTPAYTYDNATLAILVPRETSLLFYIGCLGLFYAIARTRNYSHVICCVGLLLLITCSSVYYSATRFHNHTMVAAFSLAAYYYLLSEKHKSTWRADIMMGVALGIKISALYNLPLFLFLLFHKRQMNSKGTALSQGFALDFLVLLTTAAIVFNPAILLGPFNNDVVFRSFSGVFQLTQNYVSDVEYPLYGKLEHFFNTHYSSFIFLLGLFLAGGLWYRTFKRQGRKYYISADEDSVFIAQMALVSLASLASVALFVGGGRSLQFHTFPLVVMFTLIFLELLHRYGFYASVLAALIPLNLMLNFSTFKNELLFKKHLFYETSSQKSLRQLARLKSAVAIKPTDRLALGSFPEVMVPFNLIQIFNRTNYLADEKLDLKNHTLFFLNRKLQPTIKDLCHPAKKSKLERQNCRIIKNIASRSPQYAKVYSDEKIQVYRRRSGSMKILKKLRLAGR